MERAEGGHARAHEGMGARPGRAPGRGRDLRGHRPVRVPGGARPDRAAPQRGPAHLHRVVLAGGGRAAARAPLRRRRRHRHARRRSTTTGRYTGELAFYSYGEQKAEAIREHRRAAWASTSRAPTRTRDSSPTCPCSTAVGNPVAVNPDRELRRHAEERGWQIRDFRRPVRLRSRHRAAVPRRATSVAAAVGARRGGRRLRAGSSIRSRAQAGDARASAEARCAVLGTRV